MQITSSSSNADHEERDSLASVAPNNGKSEPPDLAAEREKRQRHLHVITLSSATKTLKNKIRLECGQMPNVMAALPNIGGVLCSTPQVLTDAHY